VIEHLLIEIGGRLVSLGLWRLEAQARAADALARARAEQHLARMRALVRARLFEAEVYGESGEGGR